MIHLTICLTQNYTQVYCLVVRSGPRWFTWAIQTQLSSEMIFQKVRF